MKSISLWNWLKTFSLPLVKGGSEWDTSVLHKDQKTPPKEHWNSY